MTTRTKPRLFPLLLAAALLLVLMPQGSSPAAARETAASAPVNIQTYVDNMQPGWNLGNTLDAVGEDETAWGNPRVTRELIEQIAAQGFKSIRIPVTWEAHVGEAPPYAIAPAYLDRVEEVVDWALDANLYVMINVHHDSWRWISYMEPKHDEVLARYNAIWTQVADRFKDHPLELMLESINEPRFSEGGTTDEALMQQMVDELNVSFHEIVRASGGLNGVRPLVLPTIETSPGQERMDALYESMVELNDPNLIATVHFYGFWPFSVNIAGHTTFDQETREDIENTFDNVYNTFVAKGIPVVVGEFGLLGFDRNTGVIQQGEKLKFFEYFGHYLNEKKITTMLWDNGQHFDRNLHVWKDAQLYDVMRHSWSGRSSNAESDLIYVERGAAAPDTEIGLNLHGNTFSGLRIGLEPLQEGADYAVSGETLTLKASLLNRLIGDRLGVQAMLTAEFSAGADWTFKLVVSSEPELGAAQGTAEELIIPAKFNGDQLATLEAYYADGSNAGPNDWTPFKEFGYTFEPSYQQPGSHIAMLENFFKELKDGETTLKFHFWSGKVVEYTLVKNGDTVTGSPKAE